MKILLVNGPNLNMLGVREVSAYGTMGLGDIETVFLSKADELGIECVFFQSNHEGDIIERIHAAMAEGIDGMVINPGAYTHTSIAIRDAILSVDLVFAEVHITNVFSREAFRQKNLFSDIALGTISGFGSHGYVLALEGLVNHIRRKETNE
ncbi:MAG: type II 3-dehydroquinate dehydratase [Thermodesulfobacteriota bacterium]|nr:type II 3-dehydroquinate dehydratase [Thermodesulfobacteriota bacterium]